MIRTERYVAKVTAVDDPDQRGRIKATCPDLLGDVEEDSVLPDWIEPCHDWAWFYIPDVGEMIEIEVVANDEDRDEQFGQASIEGLDVRWRGKRFYNTEADPARPVHDDFKTNYAKRRGFATPMGHTFVFDDTEGDTRVELTWVNKDGVKSRLTMDKDGSIHLTCLDEKHDVRILHTGEFHATLNENKHSIDMVDADKVFDVKIDDAKHSVTLDGTAKTFTVSLAEDAHKIVLDDAGPSCTVSLDTEKHKIVLDGSGNELLVSVNQDAGKMSLTGDHLQVDLGSSQHQLFLDSSKLSSKLGGTDVMKVETPGKMTLGLGTDNAVAFTPLDTIWSTIMGLISGHVHPTTAPGAATLVAPTLASIATAPPLSLAKSGNIKMPTG